MDHVWRSYFADIRLLNLSLEAEEEADPSRAWITTGVRTHINIVVDFIGFWIGFSQPAILW